MKKVLTRVLEGTDCKVLVNPDNVQWVQQLPGQPTVVKMVDGPELEVREAFAQAIEILGMDS